MAYLIDTNIIIYYFNGLANDELLHEILVDSFNISIITKIEFLGWSEFGSNLEDHASVREFMSYATILNLKESVVDKRFFYDSDLKLKSLMPSLQQQLWSMG